MTLRQTLKFVLEHPLNRDHRVAALMRVARWQLGSRILPGPVAVPFIGDMRLIAEPGSAGATGNIYCGLHEFEDMALVAHVLGPADLFVDVGANVGAYTVLAAGSSGARVVSIEPIPDTFERLRQNVQLNHLEEVVELHCLGVGAERGTLPFTDSLDAINHVISADDTDRSRVEVPVETLDGILQGRVPRVVKVDVEGFETEVVEGAASTLTAEGVLVVLLEMNGSGLRYGHNEALLHEHMLDLGYVACAYEPFSRTLSPARQPVGGNGNAVYIRQVQEAMAIVRAAPVMVVNGVAF